VCTGTYLPQQPYTFLSGENAFGTSWQLTRCAQLAAFGTMSYSRVAGRLAHTEEGSGVPALSSAQRLAVAAALLRIARDPVIRPALLHAMGKIAYGVPDAVSPRGGSEWTAAAAPTHHVRYQATRARRAGGAGCPVSASKPIPPCAQFKIARANRQAAPCSTGPTPRCQDNPVFDEPFEGVQGAHS